MLWSPPDYPLGNGDRIEAGEVDRVHLRALRDHDVLKRLTRILRDGSILDIQ